METRVERIVELDAPERLEPRLMQWAQASDFACTERGPRRWAFYRKRNWWAWFRRRDADNVEAARAVVEIAAEHPLTVRTSVAMDFSRRTSGKDEDEAEVKEQVGRLAAYLRGVYDF